MFKNQRGTFYNGEMWWIMLTVILAVIIIPPIINISQYGFDEGWARSTAPSPIHIFNGWDIFLAMLIFLGYLIGGCIVLMALFAIGYWTLNYFWFERKEPNLMCRIFGHRMEDKEGEPLHIICPTCGKDFGQYKLYSTFNKETGEIKYYE
jgi:hypothetical protein